MPSNKPASTSSSNQWRRKKTLQQHTESVKKPSWTSIILLKFIIKYCWKIATYCTCRVNQFFGFDDGWLCMKLKKIDQLAHIMRRKWRVIIFIFWFFFHDSTESAIGQKPKRHNISTDHLFTFEHFIVMNWCFFFCLICYLIRTENTLRIPNFIAKRVAEATNRKKEQAKTLLWTTQSELFNEPSRNVITANS